MYASVGVLRTPWRLSAFAVCLLLAHGIVGAVLVPVGAALSGVLHEPVPVYPWTTLIAIWVAVAVVLRQVDDLPWRDVALHADAWSLKRVATGGALGLALIAATAGLLLITGTMHFIPTGSIDGETSASTSGVAAWSASALRLLWLLAPAALWEELLFRGYLWTVAERAGGMRVALWSTSIAFGLAHVTNPGASVRSVAIVVLAGLCLGTVRAETASVPAAWAAHLAWNAVMAIGLHSPVSGIVMSTTGYRALLTGARWWSGGRWGIEGGMCSAVMMGGALWLAMQRRALVQTKTRTDPVSGASGAAAAIRS